MHHRHASAFRVFTPRPLQRGFTLLEMVIVLAIMALLMGVAVMSFDTVSQEQELRRPVSELQRMTAGGRAARRHLRKAQVIIFDARGFAMRYRTDADGRMPRR